MLIWDIINWLLVITFLLPMIVFLLRMGPQKWEAIFLTLAKALQPKPKEDTGFLALDPNMFKAKADAHKLEHRVWGDEFKRLAGHSWSYKPITVEPEIWDEDADELLTEEESEYLRQTYLTEKCNHTTAEVCVHCDGVETVRNWQGQMIYQKRQRRNP